MAARAGAHQGSATKMRMFDVVVNGDISDGVGLGMTEVLLFRVLHGG